MESYFSLIKTMVITDIFVMLFYVLFDDAFSFF